MSKTFISELGDRYGGEGVSNESAHVNVIAPYFYTRNDSGNITHPTIQESIDAAISGVKITEKSDNVEYKLLAAKSTTGSTTEAVYDTSITMNPSTNTLTANLSGTATYAKALDPQIILNTALYKVPVISADKEVRWTGAPGASGSTTELSYDNSNGANLLSVNISGNAATASSLNVGAMANTGSFKLVCFDDNGTGYWETDASKGRLLYDAATNALGVSITGTARSAITADNYSTTGTIKSALDGKQSSLPTTTISGESVFNIKTASAIYANTSGTADNYSTTGTIKSALDGKQSSLPTTTISGESVFNIKTAGSVYANSSGTAGTATNLSLTGFGSMTTALRVAAFNDAGAPYWETTTGKNRLLYDPDTGTLGANITGSAYSARHLDMGTIGEDLYKVPVVTQGKTGADASHNGDVYLPSGAGLIYNSVTNQLNVSITGDCSGTAAYATYAHAGNATVISCADIPANPESSLTYRLCAIDESGVPRWETTSGLGRLLYAPADNLLNCNIVGHANWASCIGSSSSHPQIGNPGTPVYVTNAGVITACDSVNTFASVSDLTDKDGSHWDTSTTYIERDYIYCPAAPSGGKYTINMLRLRPGKVYKILLANSSGGTTIEFCKNSGTSFTFVSGYNSFTTTRANMTAGTRGSSYAVYVLRTDDNNLFQIWGY